MTHPRLSLIDHALRHRRLEFVFAAIVLALSAYALSQITYWDIGFTVGAAAWAISSIYAIANFCGQNQYPVVVVVLDFINWALFLAVWISLTVNISSNTSYCRISPGGAYNYDPPCQTIYAALTFAIVGWLLFTHSLTRTIQEIQEKQAHMAREKESHVARGERNV